MGTANACLEFLVLTLLEVNYCATRTHALPRYGTDPRPRGSALQTKNGFISVGPDGRISLSRGMVAKGETVQWMETFPRELILMSLAKNRYLHLDATTGALLADSPRPLPNKRDGVRWEWFVEKARP